MNNRQIKPIIGNIPTIRERLKPGKSEIVAALWGVAAFGVIFVIGCWLAGNPFEGFARLPSDVVNAHGWMGTNQWQIFWGVVALAIILEFLDASAGMGYGAAMTPLLLVIGFDPKQVVPAVMIQQACAGLVGAFLHKEFGNVEWKFKPMSQPIKLAIIISVTGCLTVALAVTGVYAVFKVHKVWIKLYVVILLHSGCLQFLQNCAVADEKAGRMSPMTQAIFQPPAG